MDHAAGKKQEAYTRLDKILADDKTNLQALLIKSTMLLTDGKPDEALVPAQLAVQLHGDSTAAYFTLGRIQAARQQHDAAIAAYKETLRLNPRATGAQVALARLHLASGKASESVGFAQDALKADPSNAAARLALVRGLLARGDLQQAAPEIAKLSSEFPSSATVHVQKGILLGRQKNLSEAREGIRGRAEARPQIHRSTGGARRARSRRQAAGGGDRARERRRRASRRIAHVPHADRANLRGDG